MKKFDLIVIGGGAAGLNLAHRCASAGMATALIEESEMGGTCINRGCIPTKTLIHAAKVFHNLQHAGDYGLQAAGISVDYPEVVRRKDELIGKMRAHSLSSVQKAAGMTLFAGQGSFVSPTQILVNGQKITAGKIVIAAGAKNFIPPLRGLDSVDYLTSTSALTMNRLPASLVIIGGGPIAVEFAQMFARFGVAVTILEMAPRLLMMLDPEIAGEVLKTLQADGIQVQTGITIDHVEKTASGVMVTAMVNGSPVGFPAEKLFLAAGRQANTQGLNLPEAGVEVDGKGYIRVSDRLAANVPGIWAIGDVHGGMMFTNAAWHDGFILANFFLHGRYFSTKNQLVPYAIFTDPEIAAAGLTEQDAVKLGVETKSSIFPMRFGGRANAMGETRGLIKLVADKGTGRVLGAQIFGAHAGEFIHEIVMGMRFNCQIKDLQDLLHVHPTMAETIHSAALSWGEN